MKRKIVSLMLIMNVSSWAVVDVDKEINEPVAQMKMWDDAMNRGIEEQRAKNTAKANAAKVLIMEDEMHFHEMPMLEFVLKGKRYILEKNIEDIENTKIKTKLKDRMLTITETRKIEEVVVEDSVTIGSSSTKSKFFESTTSETLSLPHDADENSFTSHYENGLLKITVKKR